MIGKKNRLDIIAYILDHPNKTQSEIGEKFGISQQTVSYYKRLANKQQKRQRNEAGNPKKVITIKMDEDMVEFFNQFQAERSNMIRTILRSYMEQWKQANG